jgi:transposase
MKKVAYVGNDVHKESVVIAVYIEAETVPQIEHKMINEKTTVQKFYRKLQKEYEVKACYEASSSGYVFHRWLKEIGVECAVVAPSLIPQRSGDRVKTDKRDAQKLGRLYRAGELTSVHVPEEKEEAIRGITRLREQVAREIRSSKQYLLKFLQVRGYVYRDGDNWTQKHWRFIRSIRFAHEADQYVLDRYISLLEFKLLEQKDIDARIEELARESEYKTSVEKLRCLRGIDTITAMGVISEVIDFKRFGSARAFMSYLGVTPGERSSGGVNKRTGITKTGNKRVRRLLVEAAWHYRHRPSISNNLKKRIGDQGVDMQEFSLKCQKRLHKRWYGLMLKGKAKNKALVAIARELAGFLWALMVKERDSAETRRAA